MKCNSVNYPLQVVAISVDIFFLKSPLSSICFKSHKDAGFVFTLSLSFTVNFQESFSSRRIMSRDVLNKSNLCLLTRTLFIAHLVAAALYLIPDSQDFDN